MTHAHGGACATFVFAVSDRADIWRRVVFHHGTRRWQARPDSYELRSSRAGSGSRLRPVIIRNSNTRNNILVGQVAGSYATYQPPATPPPTPLQGGPAIRIASFNIQVFGDSKAANQPVMWTLATIIRNFHVVAIQEIRTQDDYFLDNFLRTYVNQHGRYYDKVVGPRLGARTAKNSTRSCTTRPRSR